jgi:hypothetical protein
MDTFCRHVNYQVEAAGKYGLKVGLHNHLGSLAETTEQVEKFLSKCPGAGLILDCGHIAGAGGDPMYFVEKYFDRIVAVHVKDYVYKDKDAEAWYDRIRFCELGAGEMGDMNKNVEAYTKTDSPEYNQMVQEIANRLHLDSLKFAKLETLVKAIGLPKERICTHCFDGSSFYTLEQENPSEAEQRLEF